jgi:hypothetical protein
LWGYDILEFASTVLSIFSISGHPLYRLGYVLVSDSDRSHCKSLNTFDHEGGGSTATESLRSRAAASSTKGAGR